MPRCPRSPPCHCGTPCRCGTRRARLRSTHNGRHGPFRRYSGRGWIESDQLNSNASDARGRPGGIDRYQMVVSESHSSGVQPDLPRSGALCHRDSAHLGGEGMAGTESIRCSNPSASIRLRLCSHEAVAGAGGALGPVRRPDRRTARARREGVDLAASRSTPGLNSAPTVAASRMPSISGWGEAGNRHVFEDAFRGTDADSSESP